MRKTLLPLLLLLLLFASCQKQKKQEHTSIVSIQVGPEINRITLDEEEINIHKVPPVLVEQELEFSTILRLNVDGSNYEVFVQPGKTVQLSVTKDSISFSGDLVLENQHLLSDKETNDQVEKFLGDNWYTLHIKTESEFFPIIDSIKNIYLTSLEQLQEVSKGAITKDFIKVNQASIAYSFDRLLLRYPEWHYRFTGQKVVTNPQIMAAVEAALDRPEFLALETYQKCARTWLNLQLDAQMEPPQDSSIYLGKARLQTAQGFIERQFASQELQDYWSFQFIKEHLEQYTWINGIEFLQNFISNCQTGRVCEQAISLEAELLEARKGHEIQVYKSEKGLQLEAHIFKPENFDPSISYPALAAFHGGGWQTGHADWTFGSAEHAAENGMVGIAIEYRLSNRSDITPLEAMEDTRDAIRWIRKHSKDLSIDKNRIVGKGLSAGGHLISSISILQEEDEEHSSVPNALILVSPAIDTQDGYFKSLLHKDTDPSSLSALENLKSGSQIPPTLILQGRTDRVTPTPFAEQFKQKMDSLNYDCHLKIYEGCGHIFTPSHLDDTGIPMPDPEVSRLALEEQIAFLKARDLLK